MTHQCKEQPRMCNVSNSPDGGWLTVVLSANEAEVSTILDVSYCPFCGERLGGEALEADRARDVSDR